MAILLVAIGFKVPELEAQLDSFQNKEIITGKCGKEFGLLRDNKHFCEKLGLGWWEKVNFTSFNFSI